MYEGLLIYFSSFFQIPLSLQVLSSCRDFYCFPVAETDYVLFVRYWQMYSVTECFDTLKQRKLVLVFSIAGIILLF